MTTNGYKCYHLAMIPANEDLLTIREAAEALDVSVSTIRRWVASGQLTAFRVGPKRISIRTEDLDNCVKLAKAQSRPVAAGRGTRKPSGNLTPEQVAFRKRLGIRPPTPEQRQRALEVVASMRANLARQLAARGGKPYAPSWIDLNRSRDERSRGLS